MAGNTLKLTDREVLEYARTGLQECLSLAADGYKCSTQDLLNVLLGIGVNRGTIESICADLVGTPVPVQHHDIGTILDVDFHSPRLDA